MVSWLWRVPAIAILVVMGGACAAGAQGPARVLTVRLVNGNSGKPMGNKDVTVNFWWDDTSRPEGKQRMHLERGGVPYYHNVALDKHGVGRIEIPMQATMVEVTEGWQAGRVGSKRIRYSLCNRSGERFVWVNEYKVKSLLVPVDELEQRGFVAETECTPKAAVGAAPGEYVVLAVAEHCFPLCGLDVP